VLTGRWYRWNDGTGGDVSLAEGVEVVMFRGWLMVGLGLRIGLGLEMRLD
jgi:hypothetical protein